MATGAVPRRPDVPGVDRPHVYGVQTLTDASAVLPPAAGHPTPPPCHVGVIGSGYIGLELAEAFPGTAAQTSPWSKKAPPEVMALRSTPTWAHSVSKGHARRGDHRPPRRTSSLGIEEGMINHDRLR